MAARVSAGTLKGGLAVGRVRTNGGLACVEAVTVWAAHAAVERHGCRPTHLGQPLSPGSVPPSYEPWRRNKRVALVRGGSQRLAFERLLGDLLASASSGGFGLLGLRLDRR